MDGRGNLNDEGSFGFLAPLSSPDKLMGEPWRTKPRFISPHPYYYCHIGVGEIAPHLTVISPPETSGPRIAS